MYADAGAFAGRVETGDTCFRPLIGPNATHLIVRAGTDWNRSLDGIDAGKLNRQFSDLRKPFENALASKVPIGSEAIHFLRPLCSVGALESEPENMLEPLRHRHAHQTNSSPSSLVSSN